MFGQNKSEKGEELLSESKKRALTLQTPRKNRGSCLFENSYIRGNSLRIREKKEKVNYLGQFL